LRQSKWRGGGCFSFGNPSGSSCNPSRSAPPESPTLASHCLIFMPGSLESVYKPWRGQRGNRACRSLQCIPARWPAVILHTPPSTLLSASPTRAMLQFRQERQQGFWQLPGWTVQCLLCGVRPSAWHAVWIGPTQGSTRQPPLLLLLQPQHLLQRYQCTGDVRPAHGSHSLGRARQLRPCIGDAGVLPLPPLCGHRRHQLSVPSTYPHTHTQAHLSRQGTDACAPKPFCLLVQSLCNRWLETCGGEVGRQRRYESMYSIRWIAWVSTDVSCLLLVVSTAGQRSSTPSH
jgi:hypothetical protein